MHTMLQRYVQSASTLLRGCRILNYQRNSALFHKNYRQSKHETLYDVLGVSRTATDKEIRNAYIKLCKQFHPDSDAKDKTLHEKFVKISKAYGVLGKPTERKLYDESLAAGLNPEADEVFTTQNWNPKHPQFYYHPRFYNDPRMRTHAAKAWEANTGMSFKEYMQEERPPGDTQPGASHEIPHIPKTTMLGVIFFLMILSGGVAYRQYQKGKKFVDDKRRISTQKIAEYELEKSNTRNAQPDEINAQPDLPLLYYNQRAVQKELEDMSIDSIATPEQTFPEKELRT